MIQFIYENSKWIFSGIGVSILGLIVNLMLNYKPKSRRNNQKHQKISLSLLTILIIALFTLGALIFNYQHKLNQIEISKTQLIAVLNNRADQLIAKLDSDIENIRNKLKDTTQFSDNDYKKLYTGMINLEKMKFEFDSLQKKHIKLLIDNDFLEANNTNNLIEQLKVIKNETNFELDNPVQGYAPGVVTTILNEYPGPVPRIDESTNPIINKIWNEENKQKYIQVSKVSPLRDTIKDMINRAEIPQKKN